MPPEAFSYKTVSDHRSDIFSFGVLCYELFTNAKPFHGQTIGEMMGAIQNVAPIAPRKIDENIPIPIQNMLEKMLDKNPKHRFKSAKEIIEFIDIFSRDPKAKAINSTSFSKALFNRTWK
jgi:serine/threonine-protein kinase